jgi:magnesium-transporting ATPase (P-type)
VVVFSIRTGRAPLHRGARNPLLFAAVLGSLLVLALVVYLPALHGAFGTVSLAPEAAGLVVLLALVPAAAAEVAKTLGRRRRE